MMRIAPLVLAAILLGLAVADSEDGDGPVAHLDDGLGEEGRRAGRRLIRRAGRGRRLRTTGAFKFNTRAGHQGNHEEQSLGEGVAGCGRFSEFEEHRNMNHWYKHRDAQDGDCKWMCHAKQRNKCKCYQFSTAGSGTCQLFTEKPPCRQCARVNITGAHNEQQGEKGKPKGVDVHKVKNSDLFPKARWHRDYILNRCAKISNARRRNSGEYYFNLCTQCKPGYGFIYNGYNDDGIVGACRPYHEHGSWCYNLDHHPTRIDKSGPTDKNKICTKAVQVAQIVGLSRDKHAHVRRHFQKVKGEVKEEHNSVAFCNVWKQTICLESTNSCHVKKNIRCVAVCKLKEYRDTFTLPKQGASSGPGLSGCSASYCRGNYGKLACREVAVLA